MYLFAVYFETRLTLELMIYWSLLLAQDSSYLGSSPLTPLAA